MTNQPDMIECGECSGKGSYDSENRCGGHCRWCGGCHDAVRCEACAGTGEVADECVECGDVVVNGICVFCSEAEDEEGTEAGHGNEDGWCYPLSDLAGQLTTFRDEYRVADEERYQAKTENTRLRTALKQIQSEACTGRDAAESLVVCVNVALLALGDVQ